MVDKDTPCHHCGLAVGPHPVGNGPWFCCTGCQTVHLVLRESGLSETYSRLRESSTRPGSGKPAATDRDPLLLAELDSQEFVDDHTTELDGGLRRTRLYVNGVHCAGCVWLIERLPQEVAGVSSARLDLPRSRLTLEWDPSQTPLSTVATWLSKFGYAVQPRVKDDAEGAVREERALLTRVGVSWALAANIMLIAFALYSGLDKAVEVDLNTAARWLSMLLALPAVIYGAGPFFRRAWASVQHAVGRGSLLHLHMDTPIAIGILVGFAHSSWATVTGSGAIWFDSITILIAALLTARWIQFRSRRMAGDAADRLLALVPTMARKIGPNGTVETVRASSLEIDDRVEVQAGEVVPVDGIVDEGGSHLDNATLTGESVPVRVRPNDPVWAGSTNLSNRIVVSTRAVGDKTRVGQLMAWVRDDRLGRAPVMLLADQLSGYFVITVLTLAALTAFLWAALNPAALVPNVVALLVITCPCALGMATPLAMAVGIGRGARRGIFVKNEAAIQTITHVNTAVLDKTGTLTFGNMSVAARSGDDQAIRIAAAIESGNNHPIAQAIRMFARSQESGSGRSFEATEVELAVGHGVSGRVAGRTVAVGQLAWLSATAEVPATMRETEQGFASEGATPVGIAIDGSVVAMLAISDEIRPDAVVLAEDFRSRGIDMYLCSGDHAATVERTAGELGIPPSNVSARCEPECKRGVIDSLVSKGRVVAMIGDGVNDAAALHGASVGIAVAGSSIAGQVSSDVFLTGRGTDSVSTLFRGARKIMRVIRTNLGISLVYNLAGATAAIAGIVTPLIAAVAMPVSSLVVVVLSSMQRPFE